MVTGRRVGACLCNVCASEGVIAGRSPLFGPAKRYRINLKCDVCHNDDGLQWPEICPLRVKNDAESTVSRFKFSRPTDQIFVAGQKNWHGSITCVRRCFGTKCRGGGDSLAATGACPRQPTRLEFVAIGRSGLPVDTSLSDTKSHRSAEISPRNVVSFQKTTARSAKA